MTATFAKDCCDREILAWRAWEGTGLLGEARAKTEVSSYALTVDAFVKRYERRKLTVSARDAQESVSCDFGIRSWCAVVGLDYEAGQAPLDAIIRGFKSRPQEEVRRAVLYAARRDRAGRRGLVS